MPDNSFTVVESPRVAPPRTGLIASAVEVTDGARWQAGVTFEPVGCGAVRGAHLACNTVTEAYTDKVIEADSNVVTYDPYTLWAGDSCSAATFRSRDFVDRAVARYTAAESALMARELWAGEIAQDGGLPNFYLANGNATYLGDGFPVGVGLAWLQQNIGLADTSGGGAEFYGRAMIHAPQYVVSAWYEAGSIRREGNLFLDAFDNIVVGDSGYPVEEIAETSSVMIYATDIVQVRRDGQIRVLPDAGDYSAAVDRDTNLVEWRAERIVAAYTSECLHLAIGVDPCATDCESITYPG